ncbi:MAG: LON peptidase substrate-binding domain-containing protein [Myxococcaceae bacterium]
MTPLERCKRAMSALKIFPLPSVVLFPHGLMPLHVFEPRYRNMMRDALVEDSVIALANLKAGWERDYAGRPPLKPICTAGLIVWSEMMKDGRFNIVVQGVTRARLIEELPPTKLYREASAELVNDGEADEPAEEQLRHAVLELATRMQPALAEPLLAVATRFSGGALADAVASALVKDTTRRELLLNQLNIPQRTNAVLQEVGNLLLHATPKVGLMN